MSRYGSSLRSSYGSKSFSSRRNQSDAKQDISNTFGVNLKAFKKPNYETSGAKKDVKTSTKTTTTTKSLGDKTAKTTTTTKTRSDKSVVESKAMKTKSTASTSSAETTTDHRILKSTRINIDQENIPDFAIARPRILPVLKPKSWEKSTKDMLKKIDPKKAPEVLFFPVMTLPGSPLGYTLAIVNEEGSMQYILSSYLEAWNISEKVLKDVAMRNLEHRLENRGVKLWKRSKAGVYYLDNLGAVSASVMLLPQFLDGLDIEDGDPVIVTPSGDICLVGGAKSDTQLCIMGEIALQFSKDPQHFDMKPLRFSKNRFHEYTPKTYAQEQNVPQSQDEVRNIRLRLKPLKIKRQK